MKILSRADELVLLSVWRLQSNAYGVTIRNHVIESTEENWSIGAIYVPLDRLTKQGLLKAIDGEPTSERGGKRKRYYRLTPLGIKALQHCLSVHDKMWKDLPDLSVDSL